MELRFALRCLGQPTLVAPSGESVRIRVKKHLALLVYLAVESRRSHRRDDLAELFWSKLKIDEARHSLSTALSMFRARLGPDAVDAGREKIAIRPGYLELDIDRLLAGQILGDEFTPPLEVAGFLDGFDVPDAPDFGLWKDRQQARLLPAIKQALVTRMDRCRRTGDFRQIEELADRMLAIDDLSEEAIRAKMEARAMSGDRVTALRIFEDWKAKLAADLQAAPSELLDGMATRLRGRNWERTLAREIPTLPTEQWRDRPFVGRIAEYQALYEAWEAMRDGKPSHVLLLGDSGVGKTTLVQRLTTAAALQGAAVSRVQCYDIERDIAYAAVSALVVGLLDRPGASATPPEALAELSRTVPEVRKRFPSIPSSTDSQGETARIRLTEAFLDLLIAVGDEHPVLLVVDDLHFTDDASLAVLHLIMRRARERPIMMLFITRPGDLSQSPQAVRLRENASMLGIREIELGPLSDEESRILIGRLIPGEQSQPNSSTRRALLSAAAGHPMALELLVQDWQAYGDRCLVLSVGAMTEDFGRESNAAAAYRQVVQHISWALRPAAQNVLNLAAVLGYRLNDLEMYAIVDLNLGETISGIAELVDRRVLRDNGQKLEFANELVRGAAYLAVPSPIRKSLHSHIADRLITLPKSTESDLDLEIAWHCIRAGRQSEAGIPLLRGARDALRRGAPHSTERALSTGLASLPQHERAEAIVLLIEALQEQGRWAESLRWLDTSREEIPTDIGMIFRLQAEHSLEVYSAEQIAGRARTLMPIIRSSSNLAMRVKASRAASHFVGELRGKELAKELLSCIETIPYSELSRDDSVLLSVARCICLYHMKEQDRTLATINDIVEHMAPQSMLNTTLASLLAGIGSIRCQQGEYAEALTSFRQSYDIALRVGNDPMQKDTSTEIALCYWRLGQYQEQLKWASNAIAASRRTFYDSNDFRNAYHLALAYAFDGNHERALQTIDKANECIGDAAPIWVLQAWRFFCADILYTTGHRAEALALGREAVGWSNPILHCDSFAGYFARWLALSVNSSLEREFARSIIDQLLSRIPELDRIDQVEILCAERRIRWDELTAIGRTERQGLIQQRLEELPHAVTCQLEALGILQP